MKIDIQVKAEMPKQCDKAYKYKSLCEKVDDYMLVCESDEDSEYHWKYLKYLHKKLKNLPKLPEQYHELVGKLESFLSKHSYYDSGEDLADLEGKDMFKYRGEA